MNPPDDAIVGAASLQPGEMEWMLLLTGGQREWIREAILTRKIRQEEARATGKAAMVDDLLGTLARVADIADQFSGGSR